MNKIKKVLLHVLAVTITCALAWGIITWFKLSGVVANGIVVLVIALVEKTLREVTGLDWVNA